MGNESAMAAWQPGDLVQLKSGGPSMTVRVVQKGAGVMCDWFDKEGKHQCSLFAPEQLKRA